MKELTQFTYCPRCASPAITMFMKNAVKCDACGYRYFHNCAAAVAALIEIEGKLLFLTRANDPRRGFLDLPGGFVEYRESLEEALAREVKEECGISVGDIAYFGSFSNTYRYEGVTYFSADAFFTCKPLEGTAPTLSEENSELHLVEAGAVDMNRIAFDSIRTALRKYRSPRER